MTTTALHQVRRLPSWAPWAVLAGSVAVAVAVLALGGTPSVAGVGFLTAVVFAPLLTAISWQVEGSRRAKDRLATTLVTAAFVVAMVPLVTLVWTVVAGGVRAFSWEFLSTDMVGIFGQMTEGGAYHAIIGTLYVTGIASLIAIPLGIFTAIYLVEYGGGRAKRAITLLVDVMTGIPSIVAGLFAFTLFIVLFGPGYKSALIGGIALAVLMTPVVVRSVEEMLRLVPNELREAAYALGVPKWLTIVKIVLPTSIAGITTGIMLSISRVIGETAPLLITAGMATSMNYNLFDGRMASLPVFVYTQYMNQGIPGSAYVDRAWAGALVLIVVVMALNLIARIVARVFAPKTAR